MFLTKFVFLVFFIIKIFSLENFDAKNCEFRDNLNKVYDLSFLKKSEYWKVKQKFGDNSGIIDIYYLFNFCDNSNLHCKNTKEIGIYESPEFLNQDTNQCRVFGKTSNVEIQKLQNSEGIKIIYSNGDICQNSENPTENNLPMKSSFKIMCSESQNDNFEQTERLNNPKVTSCNLEFQINSPAGCLDEFSQKSFNSSQTLFILVIFIFLYLAIGILYNIKVCIV